MAPPLLGVLGIYSSLFLQVTGLHHRARDTDTQRAQMAPHFRSEGVSPTGLGSQEPSSLRSVAFPGVQESRPSPRLPENTSGSACEFSRGERCSCLGGRTFPMPRALLSEAVQRTDALSEGPESGLSWGSLRSQRDRSRHRARQGCPAEDSQPRA